MKQPIYKLELKISDTSESGIAGVLERILNEVNRGCYRGFDSYVDEDEDRVDCGSYEYLMKEEFVETENLTMEI